MEPFDIVSLSTSEDKMIMIDLCVDGSLERGLDIVMIPVRHVGFWMRLSFLGNLVWSPVRYVTSVVIIWLRPFTRVIYARQEETKQKTSEQLLK